MAELPFVQRLDVLLPGRQGYRLLMGSGWSPARQPFYYTIPAGWRESNRYHAGTSLWYSVGG
jgi:hypothetical protein